MFNIITCNNLRQKLWPAHSIDVGRALEQMLFQDWTAGETFELHGPREYTMREISELVDKEIFKRRRHINVPRSILVAATKIMSKYLWWTTMTPDSVEREFIDQKIDGKAKKFQDLGIEPSDIKDHVYEYLVRPSPPIPLCAA